MLVKGLLIVFFVIPIVAASAFGVVSAIIISDREKRKEKAYG